MSDGKQGGGTYMSQAGRFIGSSHTLQGASVVLYGAPFDGTTSFTPGTRFGPRRIREVSDGIETYSPKLDRDLEDILFYDHGDLELPFGNPGSALERIEEFTNSVYDSRQTPFMLGGEHLVTLPAVRAARAAFPELVLVQFDAHTDLREDYMGEPDSHATVIRKVIDLIGGDHVFQVGIRSGTREEFQYGRSNTHFFPGDYSPETMQHIAETIAGRPVYVTVDIDIIDPAFAPGTGTPESGGWTPSELFEALYALGGTDVVGCDVVEVCPPAEHGVVTSLLGAKLVREMLLTFVGEM